LQALRIGRVQHRMTRAVRGGAGALRRRSFAHVLGHSAERTLVDLALRRAAEGEAHMFEFDHCGGRFATEIFDRVLVPQPVRSLHRIVHVPLPMIRAHIAEACSNASLSSHGMASRREHLGDACSLEPGFGGAHRCPKAGPAGTDDDDVIGMIDDLVRAHAAAPNAIRAKANSASEAPPTATNSRTMLKANRLPSSWT